jgi:dTDP-4-dehydrorhamnose reductase
MGNNLRIGITGATGQLGMQFQKLALSHPQKRLIFYPLETLDITQPEQFVALEDQKLDFLVNCAAYTLVDTAEDEKELAYQVNAYGSELLAKWCQQQAVPLIHFSTDYVYHNALRRPLKESDPTRPKGIYAKSKLKGEALILKNLRQAYIFRVSWLYAAHGHNFMNTMRRLGKERKQLDVVYDQIGAPTFAGDLAEMVLQVCDQASDKGNQNKAPYGIYNYCNEGYTNWAEFAEAIMKMSGLECNINAIPSRKYPTKAPRPRNSKLNLAKFKRNFKLPIPNWRAGLKNCLNEV